MKIGLLKEGFDAAEDEVKTAVHKAAQKLKSKGAHLEEVSVPMHKDGSRLFKYSIKVLTCGVRTYLSPM